MKKLQSGRPTGLGKKGKIITMRNERNSLEQEQFQPPRLQ